jgi:hypothetical protein
MDHSPVHIQAAVKIIEEWQIISNQRYKNAIELLQETGDYGSDKSGRIARDALIAAFNDLEKGGWSEKPPLDFKEQ